MFHLAATLQTNITGLALKVRMCFIRKNKSAGMDGFQELEPITPETLFQSLQPRRGEETSFCSSQKEEGLFLSIKLRRSDRAAQLKNTRRTAHKWNLAAERGIGVERHLALKSSTVYPKLRQFYLTATDNYLFFFLMSGGALTVNSCVPLCMPVQLTLTLPKYQRLNCGSRAARNNREQSGDCPAGCDTSQESCSLVN